MPASSSKSKQRKRGSASRRSQRASAQANARSNPDAALDRVARIQRRPGVRAAQADDESATAYRKAGDFPTVGPSIRPARKKGHRAR